jgi:DNA-directed RNA polymerase I subunit RPA1
MEKEDNLNIGGLNLTGKTKLKESYWGPLGVGEGEVIIRNNELLQGILDKNHLGETTYGLNHAIYEIYGSKRAGEWLTSMARCLTQFLQYHGHTCGLDDLVLTREFESKRRTVIEQAH